MTASPSVHGAQEASFTDEYVAFDIETTGLKVSQEAITEIGAVVIQNGEITGRFQTFVDPERHLSNEIIALTGITDQMLKGAPKPAQALRDFLAFVNGRPLVAHNAEFDIGFIREGCRREGLDFDPTYVDTLILAQNGSRAWTSIQAFKKNENQQILNITLSFKRRFKIIDL